MKFFILIFFLISEFACLSQSICPIIPTPKHYELAIGILELENEISINTESVPINVLDFLSNELNQHLGLKIRGSKSDSAVLLEFRRAVNSPTDSYSILITDRITISFSSDASCFYAVNSLLQMIENTNGHI